jgi:hypothetical protein
MEVLGSRSGRLSFEVRTLCPANWRLGWFQRQGGSFEEEKMFCHCRELNICSLVVYSVVISAVVCVCVCGENTAAEFSNVKVKFALFVKVT